MFTSKDLQLLRAMGIAVSEPSEPIESMTAGDSGEPNYTTIAGYPLCGRCGRSTRNMNRHICRPCESQTNRPCCRDNGSLRIKFKTAAEAIAFATNPRNKTYRDAVVIKCQQPWCSSWHIARPHWPEVQEGVSGHIN